MGGWGNVPVLPTGTLPHASVRFGIPYIPFKPIFEPRVLEVFMKRFLVVLMMVCLVPALAAYSQNDLPQGGPGGGQPQQPQGRPGFGQQPGQGFGNQPPGGAAPAANDAAFMQQVSYGLGRNFAMQLKNNEIMVDLQALMAGINDALRGASRSSPTSNSRRRWRHSANRCSRRR